MIQGSEQLPLVPPEMEDVGISDHLAALSVEHEAALQERIVRGDRQLEDEPNRGFTIERLEGERSHEPVPVSEILPDISKRFAQEYVNGDLSIEIVEDAWTGVNRGLPGFVTYFPVAASKYKEAVAAGKVSANLFNEGKVMHTEPGAEALESLVDPKEKRAAVEAYYNKQSFAVDRKYVDDLEGITYADRTDARGELEQVSEAYELNDGGKTMRLINLSTTRLSEEQLRQAVNTVRSLSEKNGGELLDRLKTIAIVPEEYKSMQEEVTLPDGSKHWLPVNGYQSPGLLALSDRLIKPPEDRMPLPPQASEFFAQHEFDIEQGKTPSKVSQDEWELTLAHELTHIAVPEDVQRTATLSGPAPTLYGRYNKREHIAELGAAEYAGGVHALTVPEQQRREFEAMWQPQSGNTEENAEPEQPYGPRFIICRELDLTTGALPLRVNEPDKPLPVEVTYRLKSDI